MSRWFSKIRVRLHHYWTARQHTRNGMFHFRRYRASRQGFTLIELLVASLLLSVVIAVAWTGLISALNLSQPAQAKVARQGELNTALSVMTNEVRQAQSINRSGAIAANGSSVTVEDVVASSGLDLNALGNYGDVALYLELPTNRNHATCPTSSGPVAAEPIDKVVYDVRPSPQGWLSPNAVVRYGRIPDAEGAIDPCSPPVANDIVADSLSDAEEETTCAGVVTGSAGFHTCTQGDNVELLFNSAIKGLEPEMAQRSVTTRQSSFSPAPSAINQLPTLTLSAHFSEYQRLKAEKDRSEVNLSWSWSGNSVDGRYEKLQEYVLKDSEPWPYRIHIQDHDKQLKIPLGDSNSPDGINLRYKFEKKPANACFRVEGITPEQMVVESNQICIVNGGPSNVGTPDGSTSLTDMPILHTRAQVSASE